MSEHHGAAVPAAGAEPRADALFGVGLVRLTASLWWVPVALGAAALVVALALLVAPGRTLTFVAVAAGAYLLLLGLLRLWGAVALRAAHPRDVPLHVALGLGAVVAGLAVIAGSGAGITSVALGFGVYLILVGLLGLSTAMRTGAHPARVAVALLDVVAGVAMVSWPPPGIGLTALALVIAGYLLARGLVDVREGLALRRLGASSG